MSPRLRTALLWLLLALALPLQGWAASSRGRCEAPPAAAHHHAPSAHSAHALQQGAEPAGHQHPTEQQSAIEADTVDSPQAGSCSACAACCHGAVPLAALPPLATPANTAPRYSVVAARAPSSTLPERLDKPPRRSPA